MDNDKTILEWLETAQDEWRYKALNNHKDYLKMLPFKAHYETINGKEDSVKNALCSAFYFEQTKEGFDYWLAIYNSL